MIFLKENGAKIKEDFNALRKKYPSLLREAEEQLGTLEPDTALALQFLYIAMPLSDMANYRFDLFLEYALHGVWLWEHSEAVRELPEGIYLEYVLLHRVNGEEIRPCRRQFAAELWDRVAEKNAHDAAIETNFWCAEHVTYQSTDDRTLSAAATYERGYGRCGEESVFCVNALRSVGIPARQVYAPKWGHCDDNHAWVEVWCEGEWYYLGACEPEMRLNRGWFREASSRAMMVHSRSFWLPADNTVMNMEGIVSMRNQLPRYASAQEICVLALESDGTPAAGVTVTFGLLNYAEYAPVATVRTGEDGRAQFWTGFGSLYVQVAASDGRYKGSLMDTRSVTMISVKLPEKTALQPPDEWEDIDFFAPLEMPPQALSAELTLRERNMGRERLNQANQLRTSRTESWENSERVFFLSKERDQKWREKLLSVLTEKDQTDLKADILEEHLNYALPYADVTEEDLFVHYILNPRVSDEILACWRKEILAFFDDKKDCFQHDPVRIWRWITEHIESRPEREHNQVITLPAACLKGGIGSTASKKILFVAIARTFGVPARLNPCDAEPEYWDGERFVTVSEAAKRSAVITLEDVSDGAKKESTEDAGGKWGYFRNWSLARWDGTSFVSLHLEGMKWEEGQLIVPVRSGRYRLITTKRLPNGNQVARQKEFTVREGECRRELLSLRSADLKDSLTEISVPDFQLLDRKGRRIPASVLTDRAYCVMLWLEEGREPTEHILNEILEQVDAFEKYGKEIFLIVKNEDALRNPKINEVLRKIPDITVRFGDFGENLNRLGRRMYVDPENLPLIAVFKGSLKGIYAASGYNVGTGALLLQVLEWLAEET